MRLDLLTVTMPVLAVAVHKVMRVLVVPEEVLTKEARLLVLEVAVEEDTPNVVTRPEAVEAEVLDFTAKALMAQRVLLVTHLPASLVRVALAEQTAVITAVLMAVAVAAHLGVDPELVAVLAQFVSSGRAIPVASLQQT